MSYSIVFSQRTARWEVVGFDPYAVEQEAPAPEGDGKFDELNPAHTRVSWFMHPNGSLYMSNRGEGHGHMPEFQDLMNHNFARLQEGGQSTTPVAVGEFHNGNLITMGSSMPQHEIEPHVISLYNQRRSEDPNLPQYTGMHDFKHDPHASMLPDPNPFPKMKLFGHQELMDPADVEAVTQAAQVKPQIVDPTGQTWVWDPSSHTYTRSIAPHDTDRSHGWGGDADLFDPATQTEKAMNPLDEGIMHTGVHEDESRFEDPDYEHEIQDDETDGIPDDEEEHWDRPEDDDYIHQTDHDGNTSVWRPMGHGRAERFRSPEEAFDWINENMKHEGYFPNVWDGDSDYLQGNSPSQAFQDHTYRKMWPSGTQLHYVAPGMENDPLPVVMHKIDNGQAMVTPHSAEGSHTWVPTEHLRPMPQAQPNAMDQAPSDLTLPWGEEGNDYYRNHNQPYNPEDPRTARNVVGEVPTQYPAWGEPHCDNCKEGLPQYREVKPDEPHLCEKCQNNPAVLEELRRQFRRAPRQQEHRVGPFPERTPKPNPYKQDNTFPSMPTTKSSTADDVISRSHTMKPDFRHYAEEQAWRDANGIAAGDASLDACPQCGDPAMVDHQGTKVCTTCGHKQPIHDLRHIQEQIDAPGGFAEQLYDSILAPGLGPRQQSVRKTALCPPLLALAAPLVEGAAGALGADTAGAAIGGAVRAGAGALTDTGLKGFVARHAAMKGIEGAGNAAGGAVDDAVNAVNPAGAGGAVGDDSAMYSRRLAMAVSRKDFEAIAKILAEAGADPSLAQQIADYFATQNQNFDNDRFMDAAGQGMNGQLTQIQGLPETDHPLGPAVGAVFSSDDDDDKGGGIGSGDEGHDDDPDAGNQGFEQEHGDSPDLLKNTDMLGPGQGAMSDEQHEALAHLEGCGPLVAAFIIAPESGRDSPIIAQVEKMLRTAFKGHQGFESKFAEHSGEGHPDNSEGDFEQSLEALKDDPNGDADSSDHPADPNEAADREERDEDNGHESSIHEAQRPDFFYAPDRQMHEQMVTPAQGTPEPGTTTVMCPRCRTPMQTNGPCPRCGATLDAFGQERAVAAAMLPGQTPPASNMNQQMQGQPMPAAADANATACPTCGGTAGQHAPGCTAHPVAPQMQQPGMGMTAMEHEAAPHPEGCECSFPVCVRKREESDEPSDDDIKAMDDAEDFGDRHESGWYMAAEGDHANAPVDHNHMFDNTPDEPGHPAHDITVNSNAWVDSSGQPLQTGQNYKMGSPNYTMPDRITVEKVEGDKLHVLVHTRYLSYEDTLTAKQVTADSLYFEPDVEAGVGTTPTLENNDDDNTDAESAGMDSSDTYTPVSHVTDEMKKSLYPQRTWLWDDSMDKTAGADYTPKEQRQFIDESGKARNLDRLELEGTHYVEAHNFDAEFNWGV